MNAFNRERQSDIIFNLWEQDRVHQEASLIPVKDNLLNTLVNDETTLYTVVFSH
jgi:hypothetical protein